MQESLKSLMLDCFEAIPDYATLPGKIPALAIGGFPWILKLLLPFMVGLAVASVTVTVMQTGWLFTMKPMGFKFGKVFSPAGLKKLANVDALANLVKSLAKMFVVGIVAYDTVSSHYEEYLELVGLPPSATMNLIYDVGRELLLKCAIVLLFVGFADFAWTKKQQKKKLMMSKQEVKDESKASEGDPKVKGKIKKLRMEMFQKMMMTELPKATVVITNPTFIAIALRYRQGVDTAPQVVAKGKRLTAERIRDTARESGIPIIEDKPLARGLFDIVEVGDPIPAEYFAAVAEILALVYGMKGQTA
jgi:flagellar biosynthetic protein FlhB